MKSTALSFLFAMAMLFAYAGNDVVKPVLKPGVSKKNGASPIKYDESIENTIVVTNPCTGEQISLEFQREVSIRGTVNNNNVNSVYHISEQYRGTGLQTGASYVGNSQSSGVGAGRLVEGKFVMRMATTTILTTPGGGNNFRLRQVYMVNILPNGDVIMERESLSVTCQ